MDLGFLLMVALRNLRRRAMRSALTTLGIVIGVAAVIAAVAIGNGAKAKVEQSLEEKLNPSQITLMAMPPTQAKVHPSGVGPGLTLADYEAIREAVPGIVAASPYAYPAPETIRAKGKGLLGRIVALESEGFEITPKRLIAGAYFGPGDVAQATNVCLISRSMAEFLFGSDDPISGFLQVKNTPFQVIGVVADDASFNASEQPEVTDNQVFIPVSSLLRRLDRHAQLIIRVKAQAPMHVPAVQHAISNLMEQRRGTRRVDFKVEATGETLQAYTESSRTLTVLLAGIATISLLVGGIGIMNIMLVNVSERSREIGLLLAIGTRARDVQRQFLVESAFLSAVGGAAGIALGASAAYGMAHLNGWPILITPRSVAGALLCSLAIGLFFGYYPAQQASQLDPIEALRAD